MSIFSQETISHRRLKASSHLDKILNRGDALIIFSGDPIQRPGGLDQTYPFLPHPEYFWLSGTRRPHGALVYSKDFGWTDFIHPITFQEKLWEGVLAEEDLSFPNSQLLRDLKFWLDQKKFSRTFILGQPNLEQKKWGLAVDGFPELQESLNRARRPKDQEEIQWIERASLAAAKGYEALRKFVRPGVSEKEIQIEFESAVLKAGADKLPYDTIVGTGLNSAVLHAIPTRKKVAQGEMVLIDAGADIHDYCVDITRVLPADGKFTGMQRSIFEIVHRAQSESIKACKPGAEWIAVHKASAIVIAEGLRDLKLLSGSVDDIVESGAVSVFFPHGVGHMVGQRVRDVGPIFGKPVKEHFGLRLRVDLALEENFIMTVEPGVYFVPALLEATQAEGKFSGLIQWTEVDKWKNFGGIRLEDNILITSDGSRNLTDHILK